MRLTSFLVSAFGSRENSGPKGDRGWCGSCLGRFRFGKKPSTQTQLAIDGTGGIVGGHRVEESMDLVHTPGLQLEFGEHHPATSLQ